jgi:hypothetical protein
VYPVRFVVSDGTVQLTVAVVSPAVAEIPVGAAGNTATAVVASDSADQAPVPAPFTAATRKRYAVPTVKLLTVQGLVVHEIGAKDPAPVAISIWYAETGATVVDTGPLQVTLSARCPATVAAGVPGASGSPMAVVAAALDSAPGMPAATP